MFSGEQIAGSGASEVPEAKATKVVGSSGQEYDNLTVKDPIRGGTTQAVVPTGPSIP